MSDETLRSMVRRMLARRGTPLQFGTLSTTTTDTNKPWGSVATQAIQNPVTANGIFLPTAGRGLGRKFITSEMELRVDEIVIVEAPDPVVDISKATIMIDANNIRWKIDWSTPMIPGDMAILFAFGVCR